MRLKYLLLCIALLIVLLGVLKRTSLKSLFINEYYRSDEFVEAVFNKEHQEKITPGTFVHYRAVLKNTAIISNTGALEAEMARHDVMVTVETWMKGLTYRNVLSGLVDGKFDSGIRQLGKSVAKSKHKVYIRWAPDMEVPVTDYPWQFQSSEAYIKAFIYFAKEIKRYAPSVKIVWGPSGYPGDTEYWPGSQTVDMVSITLGGPSESQLNVYPKDHNVPDMLKHKLHRLRFINKPVLIIRSGRLDIPEFLSVWLTDQAAYMRQYRQTVYSDSNYIDTFKVKPQRKEALKVGVFDPNGTLLAQKCVTAEHIFTDWGELQRGDFEQKFREVTKRGHDPIVTMEPWKGLNEKDSSDVLEKILNGRYDPLLRKLFHIIGSANRTVYLRWMHEMEIPIHRYAWQSQDPVTYILAFRYFMQFEGGPSRNVKKVWGPAGDRGSIDFWPGDDVVDLISIAIYGLPDKNITDHEKQESFRNIFERKFHRMRFSDRPLFITEFGVKGPEAFQDKWLADAAATIKAYPQVLGACYFNLHDSPDAWGDIKAPDWSISLKSMNKFCDLVERK